MPYFGRPPSIAGITSELLSASIKAGKMGLADHDLGRRTARMKTFVSRMAVTMSPFLADGLQGIANIAFDHGSQHALAVGAGLPQQLTHYAELGGLFPIGKLPRPNDLANDVSAKGHFHPVCINRK